MSDCGNRTLKNHLAECKAELVGAVRLAQFSGERVRELEAEVARFNREWIPVPTCVKNGTSDLEFHCACPDCAFEYILKIKNLRTALSAAEGALEKMIQSFPHSSSCNIEVTGGVSSGCNCGTFEYSIVPIAREALTALRKKK